MALLKGKILGLTAIALGLTITPAWSDIIPLNPSDRPLETPDKLPREAWLFPQLHVEIAAHTTAVESLAFIKEGAGLLSGGGYNDGYLRVWSVATGTQQQALRVQQTAVTDLVVSNDGETIASSGNDTNLNLWQWQRENDEIRENHQFQEAYSNILALAMTPDSEVLISGGLDGIRLWNLRTRKPIYTLARFDNATYALAVHPNGYIVASGGQQGQITVWNVRTGDAIAQYPSHNAKVTTLAFTADGNTLISGSEDRSIKIWDFPTMTLRHTLIGHTGEIRALAIHPSGQFFASGSRDGIRLWYLDRGALMTYWYAHDAWVQSLAFSPNGDTLASGGFDGKVKLWRPLVLPSHLDLRQ
ncbi:MAG: WD40 repeat domain-containing protein [Jaaginema sp. PMC 1079.18]|nr:WD40 repeat domain-containing protein [Jaaginema sp. PMC 1080.18]MEC4851183.1 WD40 repeat domain-containing protein [Jaaginema sp. PMC 1079.18]MEC4864999.1 WD40 repeat domain-containing protein [Jaaginema sp. PMC 1078.18]